MPPKTERLELRLEQDLIERIDAWRARQDDLPSRSEALRRLVEASLLEGKVEPFRLSKSERLTNWLLAEILKNQIEPKKIQRYMLKDAELIQSAIFGGHDWAIEWEMSGVLHDHNDNYDNVKIVLDILDAWWFIENSYSRLSDDEKEELANKVGFRGKNPHFMGFDGNNESEYMSIAMFLVEDLGRFENFKGRDLNSHYPHLPYYRKIVSEFQSIRNSLTGREMTLKELINLLSF